MFGTKSRQPVLGKSFKAGPHAGQSRVMIDGYACGLQGPQGAHAHAPGQQHRYAHVGQALHRAATVAGQVRGIGLMIGLEFVKNNQRQEPDHHLRDRVVDLAFERGLLTLGCGHSVIRISPPLSIEKAEVDEGLAIFEEAVALAEKESSSDAA